MKKILFVIMVVVSSMAANAQNAPVWTNIKVPQLKCWECKDKLEQYLSREKGGRGDAGIVKWIIYLQSATLRIQFIPSRISLNEIQTAIANAGFDADTITAEEEAYKKLPPACKRAADGGGPQKGKPCNAPPM